MRTLLLLIFFSFPAWSHPVIYKDGWAINSTNMPMYTNNYVLYSFTNRFAAGLEHNRFDEFNTGLVKFNYLAWRHNGDDSQANVYLHSGAGPQLLNYGVEADWETRVLYTSAKHLQYPGDKDKNYALSQVRLGLSPVKAPFEQLQTWFMVQGMVLHDVDDRVMITPMLRFFYHNVLWEVGSSTRGDWMLNLMVHY